MVGYAEGGTSNPAIPNFASSVALEILSIDVQKLVQAKVVERTAGEELVDDGRPRQGARPSGRRYLRFGDMLVLEDTRVEMMGLAVHLEKGVVGQEDGGKIMMEVDISWLVRRSNE